MRKLNCAGLIKRQNPSLCVNTTRENTKQERCVNLAIKNILRKETSKAQHKMSLLFKTISCMPGLVRTLIEITVPKDYAGLATQKTEIRMEKSRPGNVSMEISHYMLVVIAKVAIKIISESKIQYLVLRKPGSVSTQIDLIMRTACAIVAMFKGGKTKQNLSSIKVLI